MLRSISALIALLTATLALQPPVFAHDGHDHKVMGTITMAAADHVMLKTTEGKDVTIRVTDTTKVSKGKESMRAEDLKVGTRVLVTAISEKDVMKAKQIQVGVAAKPAAKAAAKAAAK
jgi:hypothetical protein